MGRGGRGRGRQIHTESWTRLQAWESGSGSTVPFEPTSPPLPLRLPLAHPQPGLLPQALGVCLPPALPLCEASPHCSLLTALGTKSLPLGWPFKAPWSVSCLPVFLLSYPHCSSPQAQKTPCTFPSLCLCPRRICYSLLWVSNLLLLLLLLSLLLLAHWKHSLSLEIYGKIQRPLPS